MAAPLFVLIHSPLVGPRTWSGVAARLRSRGAGVAVPVLRDRGSTSGPFWYQDALAVAAMVQALPAGRPLVLVGHSGAGPLLPAIRQLAERDVALYLFVDAGIPVDGASRLDLLRDEMPEMGATLEQHLREGGRYPGWRDEDLVEVLPDDHARRQIIEEMQPRDLPFWTEPLPVFPGWPDAPCAYLQLSSGYAVPAARARSDGWLHREVDAGHFHMLADADAEIILDLARGAGIPVALGGPAP
ncbi:MAG: alpha/beta hydrolase [Dehalococcoidia bacterium]